MGCLLDGYRTNILAYADDIVVMAPTSIALQYMLNIIYNVMDNLSLTLNIEKSVYMVCPTKRYRNMTFNAVININGTPLKLVTEYKYLGVVIANDNRIVLDIKKCTTSFLRQFFSFYRRFKSLNEEILVFLFKTYCMSFYGCELWYSTKGSVNEFHNLEILSYHADKSQDQLRENAEYK